MMNFVDNLVHKAAGSSLLTTPEPLVSPGFKLSYHDLVSKSEESQADPFQDIPIISEPSINSLNEFTSSKSDDIYSVDSQTLENSTKAPAPPRKSTKKSEENKVSRLVDISPVAGCETSNLTEGENFDLGKSALPFETPTPEYDLGKQVEHSISPELRTRIHYDISKKQLKKKKSSVGAGSTSRIHETTIKMATEGETSSLSRKNANRVVNVEPAIEARQQAFIKNVMTKTSSDVPPSPSKRNDMKTTETHQEREVHVNIGRVEIKTSQQTPARLDTRAQGFDDYLMMRVYLDRHYS